MPIYEYQCKICGHQLEILQKFSDEPLTECPECNKPTLNKLVSATTFQLKGTGWYATDFRDKGKPKKEESSKEGAANSKKEGADSKGVDNKSSTEDKKTEKKTENKNTEPAVKSDTKKSDTKNSSAKKSSDGAAA